MDRRRAAARTLPQWAASALLAAAMLTAFPAGPASAQQTPAPSHQQLAVQLEKLTEQYNGLTVQLQRAQRAAKAAADNAHRQQQNLQAVHAQIARMAADSYTSGGLDPVLGFASAKDPQLVLDQSATFSYFTSQGGARARLVLQTLQSAARAQKAAQDQTDQVTQLVGQVTRQRDHINALIRQGNFKGVQRRPGGKIPNVTPGGASAKAMGAVNAALSALGIPYSWGGGNASGPTYGVAQGAGIKGFDCSGLTLYAYAQVGVTLPHYTGAQYNMGTHVTRSQLRPGDLVFFFSDLHHMAMYIGNGNIVQAPQTGDVVKISPLSTFPWAGAVRIA